MWPTESLLTARRDRRAWRPAILFAIVLAVAAMSSTVAATSPTSSDAHAVAPTESPDHDAHGGGGHADPFSFVLILLALIVIVAIVGRWLASRWNQPAVLGELLIGVLLGNIGYWLGSPFFFMVMHLGDAGNLFREVWTTGVSVSQAAGHVFTGAELAEGGLGHRLVAIMTGPESIELILMATGLWIFSSLGVILLLFMVGLESSVSEMLRVGVRASLVAVLGIILPFGLGFASSLWLLPELPTPAHLFLGATLCATSVGITARVFKDLRALSRPEAKVILGAAVIDDVLGLIILAVVVGIVSTGEVRVDEISRIAVLSIVFLGAVILFGERFAGLAGRAMGLLDRHNNKLLFPLALAFTLSWLANRIELATIVGAFAAGLILNEAQFEEESTQATIEASIAPLERIFAPVFFVLMGMQVNLASFLQPDTIALAAAFTAVAIAGKLLCGLPAGGAVDRLAVGIGMVPRGEVGLIFASIGRGLDVVSDGVFSALVVMIMVTTLIAPPALKWSLDRSAVKQT